MQTIIRIPGIINGKPLTAYLSIFGNELVLRVHGQRRREIPCLPTHRPKLILNVVNSNLRDILFEELESNWEDTLLSKLAKINEMGVEDWSEVVGNESEIARAEVYGRKDIKWVALVMRPSGLWLDTSAHKKVVPFKKWKNGLFVQVSAALEMLGVNPINSDADADLAKGCCQIITSFPELMDLQSHMKHQAYSNEPVPDTKAVS